MKILYPQRHKACICINFVDQLDKFSKTVLYQKRKLLCVAKLFYSANKLSWDVLHLIHSSILTIKISTIFIVSLGWQWYLKVEIQD